MRLSILPLATLALTLAGCGGSSPTNQLTMTWNSVKVATSVYLVATHASPAQVAVVTKAEGTIDGEIAAMASLTAPTSAAAVAADIQAMVAALPAGVLPPQDAAYVQLAAQLVQIGAALVPQASVPVKPPAAATP